MLDKEAVLLEIDGTILKFNELISNDSASRFLGCFLIN